MGVIILLVLLGVFFLVAELVFLPGVTLGVLLALSSYGAAAYMAFVRYGIVGGAITIGVILILSLVATIISLRAKTWQRFALKDKVVRLAHMGWVDWADVAAGLHALAHSLPKKPQGAYLEAALEAYHQALAE